MQDCENLIDELYRRLSEGDKAILIDFTETEPEALNAQTPEALNTQLQERTERLASAFRNHGAAIACIVPSPDHHIAVHCLYMHNAGARVLSITDRHDAERWLHHVAVNDRQQVAQ